MKIKLLLFDLILIEELDGPAVRALQRAIAEVKQRWSVIGWVTKNVLFRIRARCVELGTLRHAKPSLYLQSLAPTNPH
jgi:hypothetical protein